MIYGGNPNGESLRVDRMCNFCREITAFRIFERIGMLDDPTTDAWDEWADDYRDPFFDEYPIIVPNPVPQENSASECFFEPCMNGASSPDPACNNYPRSHPVCD